MPSFLKNIYFSIESLHGKKLMSVLFGIFVLFVILGILIGYLMPSKLTESEVGNPTQGQTTPTKPNAAFYKGVVSFLGESAFPNDGISYSLMDKNGNDIILLRVPDEKLSIVEGLFVEVTGTKSKTADGKNDVLDVTELVIKNGSN